MLQNILPFIAKTRMAVILSSVFCAFTMFAHTSLSEKLSEILTTKDWDKGFVLYNQISDSDITELPDSSLFDYHYLGAYFNSDNYTERPNHEKAIYHLKEAKRLCDTSLGTYFIGYMEIMNGLGDEYLEEGKFEDALAIYEVGLIKSMVIRKSAPQFFANLIMRIQECYENLGLFSEVPNHLMDAWGFWDKEIEPLQGYSYYPLWSLEQFYYKYEYFENALKINDEILKFINGKSGNNHPEMAEALYFRGNLLTNLKKYEEAIATYRQALSILDSNGLTYEDIYVYLLGNMVTASAETDSIKLTFDILDEIKTYGLKNNDSEIYKNALYSTANRFNARGCYDLALSLNSQLKNSFLTERERAIIEDQTNTIMFNKEVIETLPELKEIFYSISKNSREWFETGYKLANAYFITKELEKSVCVLNQIYDELSSNTHYKQDYYYWVLNNLYNVTLDIGDYNASLQYALERWLYISSMTDIPEDIRFSALNNLIVAKLRSSKVEDIDSDLDKCRDLCINFFGDNSTEYGIYLHNRGRAYHLQGNLNEAKRNYLLANALHIKNVGKANPRTVQYLIEVEEQLVEEGLDL